MAQAYLSKVYYRSRFVFLPFHARKMHLAGIILTTAFEASLKIFNFMLIMTNYEQFIKNENHLGELVVLLIRNFT
jgi:hypothetical protein